MILNQWRENTPEILAEIQALFKGRGSAREDETVVRFNGIEVAEGFVSVYSGRATDISSILKRAGSKVRRFKVVADGDHLGIFMEIHRDAYRGAGACFKCIDNSEPMSDEVRARFAGEHQ